MLLLSTILKISDSLTKDDFIRLAIEWNQGSPHEDNRVPGICWNGERNIRYGNSDLWLEIEEYRNQNIIAIRYEKTEQDGAVWDTDFVMNFNDMEMSVRLDRSYLESALSHNAGFSTPHFIALLIERGYLSDDDNLPVSNRPMIIDTENLDLLIGIINGEGKYRLPVVYISKTFYDEDPVDIKWIASRLKGIAHILVQKERRSNKQLMHACYEQNEYNGAIGIYYPNQAIPNRRFLYRAYEGSDNILMEKVIQSVIQYSNSQMVNPLYTWSGVNNALLRDRYSSQKAERLAAELASKQAHEDADMLISSVDEEIKDLREQITRLTKANDALTYENQGLKTKLDSTGYTPLLYMGDEEEFFQGEIKEIIMDALLEKLKNTAVKTRRHDVLSDIIRKNNTEGLLEKRITDIKNLFKDYGGLSSTLRQELIDLGFTITEEGKHYKLTYYGDGRYKTTIAKTPSDYREGKNISSTITKLMF